MKPYTPKPKSLKDFEGLDNLAIAWLKKQLNAREIYTTIPEITRGAFYYAMLIGLKQAFENGKLVEVDPNSLDTSNEPGL